MKRWRKSLIAAAILFFVLVFYFGAYFVVEWKLYPGKFRAVDADPFSQVDRNFGTRFVGYLFIPAFELEGAYDRYRLDHLDGKWGAEDFLIEIDGDEVFVVQNSTDYVIPESAKLVLNRSLGDVKHDEVCVWLERGNLIRVFAPFQSAVMYLGRYREP